MRPSVLLVVVTAAGLGTGMAMSSARTVSSCLAQPGPLISLAGGVRRATLDDMNLAAGTRLDASGARILTDKNIAVYIGGGSNICFHGGAIVGQRPPSTSYDRMHDTYGMVARGAFFKLEGLRVFNYGDGVSMDAQGDTAWSIRDVHFTYMRDDCVENDFLNSGTIENSLFDGCYEGFSARPYAKHTQDGSGNLVVVKGSLFRLQDMDRGYRRPGHGGFFKWHATSPMISLYGNVYRVDSPNIENDVLIPPPAKLKDCVGNVMIWLGAGPFPEPLPTRPGCFRLLTGVEGLHYWDDAVSQWRAAHRDGGDVAAPIVSVWSPADSATLTGSVLLTATAVDDSAVASVRFLLSDRPIGQPVTRESPTSKFTLSWNSRDIPNGRYELTATARDAAGNTTTAAPVTVTVLN